MTLIKPLLDQLVIAEEELLERLLREFRELARASIPLMTSEQMEVAAETLAMGEERLAESRARRLIDRANRSAGVIVCALREGGK